MTGCSREEDRGELLKVNYVSDYPAVNGLAPDMRLGLGRQSQWDKSMIGKEEEYRLIIADKPVTVRCYCSS